MLCDQEDWDCPGDYRDHRTIAGAGVVFEAIACFGYNVGQPTPSFRAELALDPESMRWSKLLDESRPRLQPKPIIFIAPAPNCAALPEQIIESEMFCYTGSTFEVLNDEFRVK